MGRLMNSLLTLTLTCTLTAWSGNLAQSADTSSASSPSSVQQDSGGKNSGKDDSRISNITLKGDSISLEGGGATVNGSKITITSAGRYNIKGTLNDGQIIVNSQDKKKVKLVLNGANIACSENAPIYIENAKKTVITLAEGTENHIRDGATYSFSDAESSEPDAAIFSRDDLTINGKGSLTVDGNYKNGIQSKDKLKITGGNITVTAVKDGIKSRDSISVKGGNIKVNAGSDGMHSSNDKNPDKGNVSIKGGSLDITSGGDGIQVQNNLRISGGDITISSGIESGQKSIGRNYPSVKGMKAGADLSITDGTINVNSLDDCLHSSDSLKIDGGLITLNTRNDAIGSGSAIEINGGDINIAYCYEGIESATITINDGNIHLISYDDGINSAGNRGANSLTINGGHVVVDANGDGLDINGTITMTGGVVIINGPIYTMNGALDYNWNFKITGGFIVAVGSSRMAMAAGGGTSSTQNSVMVWYTEWQEAGRLFHIQDEEGKDIITFSPKKAYSTVALCTPDLKNGSNYIVYSGGTSTGEATDGLYSGGTCTPEVQVTSFTISSAVTYAKASVSAAN